MGAGDEHSSEAGDPARLAQERAARKAVGAIVPEPRVPVLAVDTVVDLEGVELGKPADRDHAERMLRQLAGRIHRVHTAHCLRLAATGRVLTRTSHATVWCGPIDPVGLRRYLDSSQWQGKAGSYGLQDDAQSFFRLVEGSFDTVVGVHVAAVLAMLEEVGGRA